VTRINLIPVQTLSSKHLVAEYREMLRFRHTYPRNNTPKIAKDFCLGRGHVTFFYDKGKFLQHRHSQLVSEMVKRGYRANYTLDLSSWPESAMGEYTPNADAKFKSVSRILKRLLDK
jgi:deoxyribonuclease (pyrimidine dimer)